MMIHLTVVNDSFVARTPGPSLHVVGCYDLHFANDLHLRFRGKDARPSYRLHSMGYCDLHCNILVVTVEWNLAKFTIPLET